MKIKVVANSVLTNSAHGGNLSTNRYDHFIGSKSRKWPFLCSDDYQSEFVGKIVLAYLPHTYLIDSFKKQCYI